MATVTGLTAERMLEIEAESIVGGSVDTGTGHLILIRHDGGTVDAGLVVSSENLVDTIDDQSINGLKTFLELGTFEAGVASKYISLGVGLDGTQSAIFANVPTGQSAQIVNIQKNGATQYQIDQNAQVSAIGSDHYFGTNALGGTGERLHIDVDGSNVFLKSEASHADASLILVPKGLGGVYFQKIDGTNWGWFGSDGVLNLQQQSLHIRTNASGNKRAQIFLESFSGVPEWSLLSDSLVNGTHDVGIYDNVNSRFSWRVDSTNAFVVYGSTKAIAVDNYFGVNADGSTGSRVRLTAPTSAGIGVFAESSDADCSITIMAKGASSVFINPRSGSNNGLAISTDVNGKVYLVNNASGSGGSAPGIVLQPRTGGDVQVWNGTNTLLTVNGSTGLVTAMGNVIAQSGLNQVQLGSVGAVAYGIDCGYGAFFGRINATDIGLYIGSALVARWNADGHVHLQNKLCMFEAGGGTYTTATAGTNGAPPDQVRGYVLVNINGSDVKIPYYNT